MANNVVNNQESKGYQDGNKDGLKGDKFHYNSSNWQNWSNYAIDTYKKGYKLGYKSGQISKDQNDRRSRQMQYKNNQKPVKQSINTSVENEGCLALIFTLVSSALMFLILIFNLI